MVQWYKYMYHLLVFGGLCITCLCSEVYVDIPLGPSALVIYLHKPPPQQMVYQAYMVCHINTFRVRESV